MVNNAPAASATAAAADDDLPPALLPAACALAMLPGPLRAEYLVMDSGWRTAGPAGCRAAARWQLGALVVPITARIDMWIMPQAT